MKDDAIGTRPVTIADLHMARAPKRNERLGGWVDAYGGRPDTAGVDVQQLRCFVAVAEELHFGHAAERLHLTPSPVSRAVKDLERELGTDLFIRRYHQVELTPAGRQLVQRATALLAGFDQLKTFARQASVGAPRILHLGGTHLAPPTALDAVVEMAERTCPQYPLDVTLASSSELLPALKRGELELAVVHLPLDRRDFDSMVLARYRFSVAMRADDPLAAASELTLVDIAHRTLTIGPPTPQPLAMNRMRQHLVDAGITSFHEMPDHDALRLADHIRRSHGLTLVVAPGTVGPSKVFDDPVFAVVPLRDDALEFLLGLAWRRSAVDDDEVVRGLVQAAHREWDGHPVPL